LEEFGIVFDPAANERVQGESSFHAPQSRIALWVIPTNEEIVVARQCVELLKR
jgi:acetate kinase